MPFPPHVWHWIPHYNGPCTGVSPTATRWVYAMPEHTGTATIHGFLSTHKEQMSIDFTNCAHTHYHLSPPGANFTFAMVANPFRRVLSNAFHRFQWNLEPRLQFGQSNETVAAFRRFVMADQRRGGLCAKHNHMTPHCLWVQASFLGKFPKPRLVYPVAQLETGFKRILQRLGYPDDLFTGFETHHCASSCVGASGGALFSRINGTRGKVTLKANASFEQMMSERQNADSSHSLQWYDAESAEKVRRMFLLDFEAFNFSQDPMHMWDPRAWGIGEALEFCSNAYHQRIDCNLPVL